MKVLLTRYHLYNHTTWARDGAMARALASHQVQIPASTAYVGWVCCWFSPLLQAACLCSERFFSGYSGFPLSSKTIISKFQFDQEPGRQRTILWMCYLQIIIYLFMISPKDSNNRTTNYLNSAMWKYREEVSHHRISSTDLKVRTTY